MPSFQVKIARPVENDLQAIDAQIRLRVLQAIKALADDPYPFGTRIKKLKGFDPALYRLRVGDYRILYRIDSQTIVAITVVHRRYIERKLKSL